MLSLCGIIGCAVDNPKHIKRDIYQIYRNQQYRGKNGFGIGIKKSDGKLYRDRTKFEHEIFKSPLWDIIEEGDLFVLHHRTPTSTPNRIECNHPLANPSQTIYLSHNGIISGYEELSNRKFESEIEVDVNLKFGWQFNNRFTDSELAIHRLDDLLLKNDMLESVKILGEENYFSAFLIFHVDEHKIFFTSNGADLNYYEFGGNKFMSSLPFIKKFKDIENCYGYIDEKENVIRHSELSFHPTYLPRYSRTGSGFYDDSAEEEFKNEENRLIAEERLIDITDSYLFIKYKQEHGCCDICEKCDFLEDCLDTFKEWKFEELEMR